jgi:replicative superfamily II helicase
VLTYEKFAGLALGSPHLLKMLSVVVIDEVQTIVDPGRCAYLEFLLTLLKVRRSTGVAPQIVALSAVLGDLGALDSWLEATVILGSGQAGGSRSQPPPPSGPSRAQQGTVYRLTGARPPNLTTT